MTSRLRAVWRLMEVHAELGKCLASKHSGSGYCRSGIRFVNKKDGSIATCTLPAACYVDTNSGICCQEHAGKTSRLFTQESAARCAAGEQA